MRSLETINYTQIWIAIYIPNRPLIYLLKIISNCKKFSVIFQFLSILIKYSYTLTKILYLNNISLTKVECNIVVHAKLYHCIGLNINIDRATQSLIILVGLHHTENPLSCLQIDVMLHKHLRLYWACFPNRMNCRFPFNSNV